MGWLLAGLALAVELVVAVFVAPWLFPGDTFGALVLRAVLVVVFGYALGVAAVIAYGAHVFLRNWR